MELYLTSVFILLNIVGLNGQMIRNVNSNRGPQQQQPQQITAAANFAVNNLNEQSRRRGGRRWYTLTNIENSNTQSMQSLVHTIDMILTESMCLNTNNYQGATQAQCPPYNGGAVMRCSVTVLQQPMSFNFRLQNSNCSPVNLTSTPTGTAQTGNSINNQPVQSTGSTNSPQGLRDAANFATNQLNSQNRQQAPNRRWYTLMDIRNPRQQTTNSMIYNMDILLSESSCPNTIAYINASPARCPPAPGSNSQLCSVVVSYTPTRVGYRLTNYNCQREQQQQNVQGTNPVSQPNFTPSGSIGTNTNTGPSSTTNVNIPNIRGDIGPNQPQVPSSQVTTQTGQPNPRPKVNQNGLQQQNVGPQTGTGAGAITNIPVNSGLPTNIVTTNPDGSINFNPGNSGPRVQTPSISSGVNNMGQLPGLLQNGPLNLGSSVNLNPGGFGSQIPPNGATNGFGVPQANRPPTITVNNIRPFSKNVATNPRNSMNPNNFGSGVPQLNSQGVNSGVGGGFVQTSGPGQMGGQGQRRTVSLTGPQTQFMPRGQQINNAGQSTGANVPVQQSNQIDPQVSTAAIFATNTYNAQMRQQFSSDDKWYSLININNVRRQGNGGSVINMDISLQQTSCLNTAASTGATINHCPPISGGRVRVCSVSVVYASMRQGFRLLGSNCRDAQLQQRAAGSPQPVMSFPTPQQGSVGAQPITGASSTNTNNPQQNQQIRRAANTATNKINDRSRTNSPNDNQWYILTEIQDPQIQNVGGSLIDMNLILSQSTCLNVAANVDASSSKCPVNPGGLKKVCSVKLWHESFNVEDKLLSFSCQQPEISVIQGPTFPQQTQQQSVVTSGVQPAPTAASIIPGAVLNDPVVTVPFQAASTNILTPGNSLNTGSQSGTGISSGAGPSTGSSTSNAAITLAGVNTNTEMLPNGMANIASTTQGSFLNQGPNTNSATSPQGVNTNPSTAPLGMNTNPATAPLGMNSNPSTAPPGMNTNPSTAPLGMNTNSATAPLGINTNPSTAPLGMNSQANNQGSVLAGSNAGSTQGSPRVIDVANFATNEINTRNRQTEQSWFTLVDLTNATRQELASGGWIYQMEIIISESICQNTEANFNTNTMQCPERNGGRVQQCLIEVMNQPNVTNLQLDRMECMLDPQSQTGPSNMLPGVQQQPLPNSPQQQQVPAATVTTAQVTPEIMDAARFAAQEINMQIRQDPNLIDPKWFTLADVKYPQQKFLGGMVYSMEIDLVESTCLNIDQNINANTTQCPPQNKASTKTCYIEVERVPVLLTYKLAIQHCSTHGFSNNASLFTKAQTQPVANQTQEITAAANFAVNKINEQNRKPNTNRFVLVDVHNPQEKSFSGWEYRMNLMLQQSDCPNTPAYNDATVQQCPPQTGGPLRLCEVRVFHQPWTFGYRLEDAQCLNQ